MIHIETIKFGDKFYGLSESKEATDFTYISKHPNRDTSHIILNMYSNPIIISEYDLRRILDMCCKNYEDAAKLELKEMKKKIESLKFRLK